VLPRTLASLQVQSWTYSAKTRVIRAGARAARDSGVRVRELTADELTPEMRHKMQNEVTGGNSKFNESLWLCHVSNKTPRLSIAGWLALCWGLTSGCNANRVAF
jgi:hypothetical protein